MNHILLTGATGLIGGKLLGALSGSLVTCLARNPAYLANGVRSDITEPRLGLDAGCYRELTKSVTDIIHCAADIRFGQTIEQAQEVNVQGTLHLIEFARECPGLRRFAHISTVYVTGKTPGTLPEALVTNTAGFFNAYEQSKYEAEHAIAEAWHKLPMAIFRLSTVIGSAIDGRVEQFNYFHQLLKWAPQNPLPMIPGNEWAVADLIPTEWVVAALASLVETAFEPGQIYNVCAGREGSLGVKEILQLTFDLIGTHTRMPRLVSLEEFEAFAARRSAAGEARIRELLSVVSGFLPHLAIPQFFENTHTAALLRERGIELPPLRSYYTKVMQYCVESKWGREPLQV